MLTSSQRWRYLEAALERCCVLQEQARERLGDQSLRPQEREAWVQQFQVTTEALLRYVCVAHAWSFPDVVPPFVEPEENGYD